MLFTYVFITHPFGDMQTALDALFCEIWCKSSTISFEDSICKHDEVREFFDCMKYSTSKSSKKMEYTLTGKKFFKLASEIHQEFGKLADKDRNELMSKYQFSQDIEGCLEGPAVPLSKKKLNSKYPILGTKLEKLFKLNRTFLISSCAFINLIKI